MKRLSLVAAALALVLPGAATAATWSVPETISTPHTFVGPLLLTRSATATLAAWSWQDGTTPASTNPPAALAGRGDRGSVWTQRPGPDGLLAVVGYTATRTLLLSQEWGTVPRNGVVPSSVRVTIAATETGAVASTQTLVSRGPVLGRASMAVSRKGGAIVAWVEQKGRRRIVKAAVRPDPGDPFGRPFVLSGTGQAEQVVAAAGERGDLMVVMVRNKKLIARVKLARRHWRAVQTLTTAKGRPTQWQIQAAIGPTGRFVVAWRRHVLTKDGDPASLTLESSTVRAGHTTFPAVPQVVDDSGVSAPSLIADGNGMALAWTHDTGLATPEQPRVALQTSQRASFGAPVAASDAVGGLRDVRLTGGADGSLYAVWIEPREGGDSDGVARGALLPAGARSFAAAEDVTPDENVHEAAVAYDPAARQFVALWTARPDGTGPATPVDEIRSVVRTARRAP